ncbi:MAG: cobinamide kinase [Clostridiales bacterium]|nr:cobinamide kinase [Clostridiales bacterium]
MMTLVIGGSGSGKSAYAENCLIQMAEGKKKYYLATMQVLDEEGQKRIERHRRLRSGKGFLTIEQPTAVQNALTKMEAGEKTALLECISNLTANEMFAGGKIWSGKSVADRIIRGIEQLKAQLSHLVIVGNNVFEDGMLYDETTMEYIRTMGSIQTALVDLADEVVEVVAGIPIVHKGQEV